MELNLAERTLFGKAKQSFHLRIRFGLRCFKRFQYYREIGNRITGGIFQVRRCIPRS